MADAYEVLGLAAGASDAAIRQRYLELVRESPPDRDPQRFAAIRAAYDELRDPVQRLRVRLFEFDASDSLDAILADARQRLRSVRLRPDAPFPGGATMNGWPDDENVLTCFRQWLHETRAEAAALGAESELDEADPGLPSLGLLQLVEEFTALRQEVKLQTKSGRGLEEKTDAAVAALREAIGQFRSVEAKEAEAVQRAAGPLVQALIDLDEAVERARIVLETARRRIVEESPARLRQQLEVLRGAQWWWRRWLCRPWHEAVLETCAQHGEVQRKVLESLLEGYSLVQNRLRKTLQKEQIVRIDCVGKAVDPNRMTVIEVVEDSGRAPGSVIEEVRPGYSWKDKVFRFAEVRAAASPAAP